MVGNLIKEHKIPPRDAWNMTFREFSLIQHCSDKKPFRLEYTEQDKKEMISAFELRDIYNGNR